MCVAQQAGLQGPVSGLMFDAPSRAIRVVNGIPGAAYLGAAVAAEVDAAWVSPDGTRAVVVKEGTRSLVSGLLDADPLWIALDGLPGAPDHVSWQADSQFLALLFKDAATLQVLRLDPTGIATQALRTLRDLPGTAVSVAVAGEVAFVAMKEEQGGGIYRSGAGGTWTLLTATRGAASLELGAAGVLYAAESGTGDILEIRGAGGPDAPAVRVIPAGRAAEAVALQVSVDGKRLLVARGGEEAHVQVWDLERQEESARVALDSAPQGLEPLPGGPHLLLTQRKKSGDVITILAERAALLSVFFVPAGE
jgi:hypothetical protein